MRFFGINNPVFLSAVNESSVVTNGLITCIDAENPKCFASSVSMSFIGGPDPVTNLAYVADIPIDNNQLGTTGAYYIAVYAYKLAPDNTKIFSSGTTGYFSYSFGSSTYFSHHITYTGVAGVDGYYIYVYVDTPYGNNYDFYVDSTITSFYVDYGNVYDNDGYYSTLIATYGNNNPDTSIINYSTGYNTLKDLTSNKEDWKVKNYSEYSSDNKGILKLVADAESYITNNNNLKSYYSSSTAVSFILWYNPISQSQILSELGSPDINVNWHDAQIDLKDSGSAGSGSFYMTTWYGYTSAEYRTTNPLPYQKWYHLAFTHTGDTFYAYLNGNLYGSSSFTRVVPYNSGYDLYYAIGAKDITNPEVTTALFASGSVGAYFLYNRSLTANEILQNYKATKNRFLL